ncbi:hypothetical protein MSAN_01339800 [Mycena sanguinolenta]|uniref:Uncharacterized protein n=1 Tax=Mycena sanguinolenta TaxID=230812 RepID=A0A8H6YAI9_9AGAR|nr:hypothetical protein MSAN_01339800 [Mycena sanguinolenta]
MPSVQPSPSASSSPKASTSPTLPIAVTVIAVLVLVSVMLLTLHFRKKKISAAAQARKGREVRPGEVVSRVHPAALMITPANGEGTPRFVHTAGTNMRVATRRPDGAWEFADSRAPFTPSIIADASDTASISHPPSRSTSPVRDSPYSRTSVPGSSSELLPPPVAVSNAASPWGAPTTPRTADSARSPWRSIHSPSPSTSASTFLPTPSIAASSRRTSTVSSSDSFLDLEPRDSTYSNPFLSPASTARWPTSPSASARSSPGPSARSSPESPRPSPESALPPPEPRVTPAVPNSETESRAAREIRLGYEQLDRNFASSHHPPASGNLPRSARIPRAADDPCRSCERAGVACCSTNTSRIRVCRPNVRVRRAG